MLILFKDLFSESLWPPQQTSHVPHRRPRHAERTDRLPGADQQGMVNTDIWTWLTMRVISRHWGTTKNWMMNLELN